MERTKKIISILLVFLLSIGVCCNFKVFAEVIDVSMPKEEYNKKIIEELGLTENSSTEKSPKELGDFLYTLTRSNMENKDWFSVNGKSDLISLYIYGLYNSENTRNNPDKKYNVSYSTKDDGYIRSFTIEGLEYTYPGVMPTDTTFGIPYYSKEVWNSIVNTYIPQSPSEVTGKDIKEIIKRFAVFNWTITENYPSMGLTINGKSSEEDLGSIYDNIREDAKYKAEYTMDNGYIRRITFEEITASVPTPVPSETEQMPTTNEQTENPTESQTETQNQETSKQHILDDEPNTGLVF